MRSMLRAYDTEARQRVLAMRRVFGKFRLHLAAVMLVGIKRPEKSRQQEELDKNDDTSSNGSKSRWDADWRRARFS